ncbi:glycosyltransferase family 2 protein [Vibrio splendidus]
MFSVVIVTKNRISYLRRALDSIKENTIQPSEVIIVNDGGEVPNISDENVILINNDQSYGANYSRNLGANVSKEEIIFFLDDDDAYLKTSFSDRLHLFNDEEVGLVYTGARVVKSSNLSRVVRSIYPIHSIDYHLDLLSKGNIIGSTSRVAVRRKHWLAAGAFDEKLQCRQDFDLWIRMSKICDIRHDESLNIYYTVYEDGGDNITSGIEKFNSATNYIFDKYIEDIALYNKEKEFYSSSYFRIAKLAIKESNLERMRYSFRSFVLNPKAKSFLLFFLPNSICRRIFSFS